MTASQRTNLRGGTSVSAEENRKEKTVSRGVSLNMLNILMTRIGVLAAVLMIINNIRANRSYQLMDAGCCPRTPRASWRPCPPQ